MDCPGLRASLAPKKGRAGCRGLAGPHGPCAKGREHTGIAASAGSDPDIPHATVCAGLWRFQRRRPTQLAPHEPRWSYLAFPFSDRPFSIHRWRAPTPAQSCLGTRKAPDPESPVTRGQMRAGHRTAWAAATRVRHTLRPSPPRSASRNAFRKAPLSERG